jgi:hypothetical protein
MQGKDKQFFFEKKNQKTFDHWIRVAFNAHSKKQMFFLLFQKEALPCFLWVSLDAVRTTPSLQDLGV